MPPWGINWLKYHQDQDDLPHVERMGYASFTIYEWMWNNRDFCADLVAAARKDAIFLNRDHPMSEQKDDQWKQDPAGKGRAHADDWAQKVQRGDVHTPLDRTYFLGLNEPNSEVYQVQIDAYNEAFARRMAEHGLRIAAYSFGVGHPSTVNLDPKADPDWHWYAASAQAILDGGHIVATHEYGAHDNYGWGFWCGRIAYCPYPFTVIFDECGIDNGVTGGPLYGYQMYLKPLSAYCDWLDNFQVGQAKLAPTYKVKVHSYNIFCFDHGRSDSKDWVSYDIRPIRPDLEKFKWTESSTSEAPPFTLHLPSISKGDGSAEPTVWPPFDPLHDENWFKEGKDGTVTIPALNVRKGPGLDYPVTGQLHSGDSVEADVEVERTGFNWVRIAAEGWVSDHGIQWKGEAKPQPSGDLWERSWPIVLSIEGGLSTDPHDPGNYRPDGTFVGTKWGISANAHPDVDIVNLTKEQALDIYKRDYWDASGANELPWPMALYVFDTAVNHGTGTARQLLKAKPTPEQIFLGQRALRYFGDPNWARYGVAWGNRVRRIEQEGEA